MLDMRSACRKGDLHIRYRRTRQHAEMLFFAQVHKNQPLPVAVKRVLAAIRFEHKSAAPRQRLQDKMNLGIMAQRLIVTDTLNGVLYRFLIHYPAGINIYFYAEPLGNNAFEYLSLNLAHKTDMNFFQMAVPRHMKLGVLLFKLTQLRQERVRVTFRRKHHTIIHNRLKRRLLPCRFKSDALTVARFVKTRQGAYIARLHLVRRCEFCAGIKSYAADFFIADHLTHLDRAARYLDVSQSNSLRIMADLENLCAEGFGIFRLNRVLFERAYKFVNAVKLQSGSEKARKDLPHLNRFCNFLFINRFAAEVFFHQAFTAKSQTFSHSGFIAEIDKFTVKLGIEIFDYLLAALSCKVHFSHKNKRRHIIKLQKLP